MSNKGLTIVNVLMAILVIFLLCVLVFKSCNREPIDGGTEVKKDTIYIHHTDTVLKDTIIYKWKKVKDTVYLPADTMLFVEQKYYEDSFSAVWISGIEPEIDSIKHFIPRDTVLVNTEITHTIVDEVRSGFGICLGGYAGYGGAVKDGQVYVSPEIGIGGTIGWCYIFKHKKKKSKN